MVSNYFLTWLRNARKYRTYTAINLLGLGIGIACCYLCVLYFLYDWSFDRFHQDYRHIYRIAGKAKYKQIGMGPLAGIWAETSGFPTALASEAIAEIPEIEMITRVRGATLPSMATWRVGVRQDFLNPTDDVLFVDDSFLKIFTFPIIAGSFQSDAKKVIITQDFAHSLSSNVNNLIGKILWMRPPQGMVSKQIKNTIIPVEIGGIVSSPPHNSSLTFSILLPFTLCLTTLGKKEGEWDWFFSAHHYVRLTDKSNIDAVERKLTQIVKQRPSPFWDIGSLKVGLQPIADSFSGGAPYGSTCAYHGC